MHIESIKIAKNGKKFEKGIRKIEKIKEFQSSSHKRKRNRCAII